MGPLGKKDTSRTRSLFIDDLKVCQQSYTEQEAVNELVKLDPKKSNGQKIRPGCERMNALDQEICIKVDVKNYGQNCTRKYKVLSVVSRIIKKKNYQKKPKKNTKCITKPNQSNQDKVPTTKQCIL